MSKVLRVLFLEDAKADSELVLRELKQEGITAEVRLAASEDEFLAFLHHETPDLVLADYALPSWDGIAALAATRSEHPDMPFILISGALGEEAAIQALNHGATDFIPKQNLARLRPALRRILYTLEERARRKEAETRVFRTNVLLGAVRAVNRLIIREHQTQSLIAGACNTLAGTLGFSLVSIDINNQEIPGSPLHANSGSRLDYLDILSNANDHSVETPTLAALRTKQEWVCQDCSGDPRFAPWREPAMRRGLASLAVLPMLNANKVLGALSLYSDQKDAFNSDDLELIGELADDLALAVQNIKKEADLNDSNERFRILFEHAPDAYYLHDLQGNWVDGNKAAEAMVGCSKSELIGKNIFCSNLLNEADLKKAIEGIAKNARGEPVGPWEYTIHTKDGRRTVAEIRGHPVRINQQQLVLGIARDISERKRAQEQILSQAALLEVAQDAIAVQDLSGRIKFWNSGASRLYGWTLEQAIEQGADALLRTPDPSKLSEARKQVAEKGEWIGELVQVTSNKKEITVLSHWSTVRNPDGTPGSILIVSTDITEKKRLEAQLMRAQRLESVGRLASGIAHDLNNVLTPVMMALEMLKDTRKDESEQGMLETLETCVQRGADIIQQVLMFARGAEGAKLPLQPKYLLKEMAQIAKETFPKSISVRSDTNTELWMVQGDRTQMLQVLMNLCVNARDAMPNGGILRLEASNVQLTDQEAKQHPSAKPGRYVGFKIEDTGSGIPAEILDKIFDPFFTTKPLGTGTGLGLPTALGIIESHGGFLKVDTREGAGTTFRVYIPAANVEETTPAAAHRILENKNTGEMILVVEDELAISALIRNALETYGYRVIVAMDDAEALAGFAENEAEVKVVIADLMLPGVAGQSTIRRLRALNPALKFVAISGMSAALETLRKEVPEITSVLAKPFTTSDLIAAVEAAS